MSEMSPEITDLIQDLSDEFGDFCYDRHKVGQEKYGQFSFLEKDIFQEALYELADCANYMRYQYVKLRMLQMAIAADPRVKKYQDDGGEVTLGLQSFKAAQS